MSLFLEKIRSGLSLSVQEMEQAMTTIMDGRAQDQELKEFLLGLAQRGETADELTGAAQVLRARAISLRAPAGAVDCCGTGGDNSGTYNISTAVALVAAACGVPMAKHGNRAASSKSGAADVLECLGVNLDVPAERLEIALRDIGFAFLMAPRLHTAMKHVSPIRKSLGVRTIFNLLGPLANPAGTKLQLLGVYDRKWILPIAQTLQNLGSTHAWVVHGADGLDEITLTTQTYIAQLKDGVITETILSPDDFGLKTCTPDALKGGDARENALALRGILMADKNAYRDIVLANAAAVLMISDRESDLKAATSRAAHAIDSGGALGVLESYIKFTQLESKSLEHKP